MHGGAPLAIWLGLPEYLVGHRGGVSFAEEEVAEHISDRVTLRPTEVAMRFFASGVAHVEQHGCDGVRDGRAFGAQHLVIVDLNASHLEHLLELRRVACLDLQKEDRCVLRYVVVLTLLFFLRGVLLRVVDRALVAVGDDVYLPAFTRVLNEPARLLVQLYPLRPEFGSAPHPRG